MYSHRTVDQDTMEDITNNVLHNQNAVTLNAVKSDGREAVDHNVPKYAVGTEVSKRSEDGNWHSGKITEYRVTEGWYTIKYEDGDVEDYTEKELRNLLKKSAWDRRYKEIKAYKAKFGHCNVPFRLFSDLGESSTSLQLT